MSGSRGSSRPEKEPRRARKEVPHDCDWVPFSIRRSPTFYANEEKKLIFLFYSFFFALLIDDMQKMNAERPSIDGDVSFFYFIFSVSITYVSLPILPNGFGQKRNKSLETNRSTDEKREMELMRL